MNYLKQIKYELPDNDIDFKKDFLDYLSSTGSVTENQLAIRNSQFDFLPETVFEFTNTEVPTAVFELGDSQHKVEIKNVTQISKQSPHAYKSISIKEFTDRLKDKLFGVDHTGFNLPYFDGIHPEILKLRELLKDKCLYHEFPKDLADEPWDFILPATQEEIESGEGIDYQRIRKPKIEIVSFPKSSTPLIQIDIQLEGKYEDWLELFPEAIDDPDMRNLWVYIKNDLGIDICFVLNELSSKDWSHYFEGYRII